MPALLDVARYTPSKIITNANRLSRLKVSEKIPQARIAVTMGCSSKIVATNPEDKYLRL